jgi:antitoxin PrlF
MPTATLTSKGQITMPQSVRQSLGLQAGDKIDFVPDEEGGFKVIALRKDVNILRGRFAGRVARPVSLQAMEKAVGDEAAERTRLSRPSSPRPVRRLK